MIFLRNMLRWLISMTFVRLKLMIALVLKFVYFYS